VAPSDFRTPGHLDHGSPYLESRGKTGLSHWPRPVCADETQGQSLMSIQDWIKNEVDTNDVVLFMKGTPNFPQCGFSGQVVQILDYVGAAYKGINVLEDDDLRQGVKEFTNWPTIPQLYVKGEFVGGCDIIREMFQNQELQGLMSEKGIEVKTSA
jgi:monothiol glutaredoxin